MQDYWQIVSNDSVQMSSYEANQNARMPYIYHIFSCIPFFIGKITLYLYVFDSLK